METKMVNKVELNGFAGNNPDVITIKEGYKNKKGEWVKETTWHRIVLWNKVAEQAKTLIKKGTRVSLIGKIVNNSFTNSKGEKKYSTEIVCNGFEIITHEPVLSEQIA
jgi:single-strand DNA-binding protein